MGRKPPSNLRSLETRLRNLAREQGVPERRARRLIGIVVLGQMLQRSNVAVIKGASNLEVRLGTRATRVSSDLDTVRRSSLEMFRDELAQALRDGWSGFAGVLIDDGEIATPAPDGYRPHRFRAKLQYKGSPFGTVTVEVALEEAGGLQHVDSIAVHDADEWFAELGLLAPSPIHALPLSHQIAQKIHACTTPDVDGWTNDRAHDLIDLQLLAHLNDGDLGEIRQVAIRLFAARKAHPWPPSVTERRGWSARYSAEAAGLNVVEDVDEAISWANAYIAELDAA
jgi:hypothetical protein